eukprot:TRINITY_DN48217_c0_g1_i1.p1 TRINITY_DN48217_c0_g1~~TRINITY_DN48217_c0_g1_i1.p1  ORF type:complete len:236 (+),score=57.98 TRINITY_DN48217_c0_g1_i1:99-710(+)
MAFPYEATYTEKDVVRLVDAVAGSWKKKPSEAGLDATKVFETLKRVIEQWRQDGSETELDKDLQALLALCVATKWFSHSQAKEIDAWFEEVAGVGEEEDWMDAFTDEEALKQEVEKALDCQKNEGEVTEVSVDKDGRAIVIEYTRGNYGRGVHDGSISLNDDEVVLHDKWKDKYLVWNGDTPYTPEDLAWCIWDPNWVPKQDW